MIIRCVANSVNDELAIKLGLGRFAPKSFSALTPGSEYVVLGISYLPKSEAYGISPTVLVKSDTGSLSFAPLAIFEITESTPSRYWEIRWSTDGILKMWPSSFYEDFYHDDLLEGIEDVRRDFETVVEKLEKETGKSSEKFRIPGSP